ncbi:MAG: hypothetical protein Alpg2KO_11510 [Alphaproteobacteria bacterium]
MKFSKKRGVTAVGYGLLVGLIGVVALASITAIGDNTSSLFGEVSDQLESVSTQSGQQSASGPTPPAEDETPDAFSFTQDGYASTSSVIPTQPVQITGITVAAVSVSGDGSPEFQICADANCSSIISAFSSTPRDINDGEYLQIRLTAAPTAGQTRTASVTVGDASVDWDVTAGGSDLIMRRISDGQLIRAYENVDYPFVPPGDAPDQIQRFMVDGTCSRYGKTRVPVGQSVSNFEHVSGPARPNGRFAFICNTIGSRNGISNVCTSNIDTRDSGGTVAFGGGGAYNTSLGIFFFCLE